MYPAGVAYMAGLVRAGVKSENEAGAGVESGRPKRPFQQGASAASGGRGGDG